MAVQDTKALLTHLQRASPSSLESSSTAEACWHGPRLRMAMDSLQPQQKAERLNTFMECLIGIAVLCDEAMDTHMHGACLQHQCLTWSLSGCHSAANTFRQTHLAR